MRVAGGRAPGRRHRQAGVPCQDAYAVAARPERDRVVAAVSDGLGSRPHSDLGSQVACEAAVRRLADEPVWDEAAMQRAFEAARDAVASEARGRGLSMGDLACTLQLAGVSARHVLAGMVGDGAVVACLPEPRVLLAPPQAEYANEVVPITAQAWIDGLRIAHAEPTDSVLLFTDGLTRLLLARNGREWRPFQPFFEAFLPRLRNGSFDEGIVDRFLQRPDVDGSWDDDKCLVVVTDARP